jgi:murein DD-endopeptidase MepM/ murein hydrolase activator NlpD
LGAYFLRSLLPMVSRMQGAQNLDLSLRFGVTVFWQQWWDSSIHQAWRMAMAYVQRLMLVAGLLVVMIGWMLLSVPPARAVVLGQVAGSVEELQKQQIQLDQQRSQVSEEKKRLKILENSANTTLNGLQSNIKTTTSDIKASEGDLQTATKTLQQLETKLTSAEQTYRQKQLSTIARLQFLQRQRLDRGWAVLLQSQSLNEFLDRRYHLKKVYQSDRQMLVGLKIDADRLEQQRNLVEGKKNEITLMTQQLMGQKSTLQAQAVYQKESIGRLKSDRRAMEVAETQLEQDVRTISSIIQQRMSHGIVAYRGTGQMILPCPGEITSGFGWRVHPVLGYERFHSGLDVGADYGTVINAADRGMVIFAGWYGGYGNAVIIDHGGGLTTLYGHTSELYVAEGQEVQRGQAIAAVGSTGLSTGPHLHFEVRREGDPVDPVAFL